MNFHEACRRRHVRVSFGGQRAKDEVVPSSQTRAKTSFAGDPGLAITGLWKSCDKIIG